MIRDRLKNLFEIQCGEKACVDEDYAGRIIMVLLSKVTAARDLEQAKCEGLYGLVYSYTNCLLLIPLFGVSQKTWCGSVRSFTWLMCSAVRC